MDPESERLSSLLYLQGVLPALCAFMKLEDRPPGCGELQFMAPHGQSGRWPEGESSGRAFRLHFFRHRDVISLFEGRRFFLLPGWGFWRIGVLLRFQKTARAFQNALREPSPPAAVRAVQLHLLLRSACLLHGEKQRMGSAKLPLDTPRGWLEIHFHLDESGPEVIAWTGLDPEGQLSWGEGRAPDTPAGVVSLHGQDVLTRLFSGNLIDEAAIGRGEIEMGGNIPMIQALNLAFEDVENYLKPL